jgi:hypothetical protein
MKDILVTAVLSVAALLGCVRFVGMFAERRNASTWEHVTTTVGVTVFLTASGRMLERGGLAAAVLLLLLTWVVYGMVRNHPPSQRIVAACTWLGLALLLAYIGFDRG